MCRSQSSRGLPINCSMVEARGYEDRNGRSCWSRWSRWSPLEVDDVLSTSATSTISLPCSSWAWCCCSCSSLMSIMSSSLTLSFIWLGFGGIAALRLLLGIFLLFFFLFFCCLLPSFPTASLGSSLWQAPTLSQMVFPRVRLPWVFWMAGGLFSLDLIVWAWRCWDVNWPLSADILEGSLKSVE